MKNKIEILNLIEEANMIIVDSASQHCKILAKVQKLIESEKTDYKRKDDCKVEIKGQFLPGTDIPGIDLSVTRQ